MALGRRPYGGAATPFAINICEGCWEAIDPDVWTGVLGKEYVHDALSLMKAGDYFALLLVTTVVCIQASNEARDGKRGNLYPAYVRARLRCAALRAAGQELSTIVQLAC